MKQQLVEGVDSIKAEDTPMMHHEEEGISVGGEQMDMILGGQMDKILRERMDKIPEERMDKILRKTTMVVEMVVMVVGGVTLVIGELIMVAMDGTLKRAAVVEIKSKNKGNLLDFFAKFVEGYACSSYGVLIHYMSQLYFRMAM